MKKYIALLILLAIASVPAKTEAAASADSYNFAGVSHNLQCISLNKINVQLLDASGNSLGLVINNKANSTCSGSRLRFQGIEGLVTASGRDLYYVWGVGGSDGQSGHVWVADMTARPSVNISYAAGNGKAAPDIYLADGVTRKSYYIKPVAIPYDMGYYGPTDGKWRTFDNYGTPAAPYSSGHTSMAWSWVNKGGGGISRAMMKTDEVFYPSDVNTINMTAYNSSGAVTGSVKALYGSFWNGKQRVYGWIVHSHIYNGTYVPHIACRTCD